MRGIKKSLESIPTLEGAGVRLRRVFGFHQLPQFDPFLLLDHFGSKNPDDYIKGFPWHPHRGIETVTYMISGKVEHGDSLGNKGVIGPGEVQWMTAGSGIIHQEMPQKSDELKGFQLWVNLPQKDKMTAPRYKGISAEEIRTVENEGCSVKIISGEMNGMKGPVNDLFVDVDFFDIHLSGKFSYETKKTLAFIYVYEGKVIVDGKELAAHDCALLDEHGAIEISGSGKFLFVAGNPLEEPVAWGGPIVMNTDGELEEAFREIRDGTFTRNEPKSINRDFYRV